MQNYSLGTLTLEMVLDGDNYNRQMERYRKLTEQYASDMERALARVKAPRIDSLVPTVDDRALTALNKHLDVKQKHWEDVKRTFSQPIKPGFDRVSVDQISGQLSKVEARYDALSLKTKRSLGSVQFGSNGLDQLESRLTQTSQKIDRLIDVKPATISILVDSSSIDAASSRIDALSEKNKAFALALEQNRSKDLSQNVVKPVIDAGSISKDIAAATKSIVLSPITLPLRLANNLLGAAVFQIGNTISGRFATGLADALEAKVSQRFGSSRLLGQKLGEAASTIDAKSLPGIVKQGATFATSRIAGKAIGGVVGAAAETATTKAIQFADSRIQPIIKTVDSVVGAEAVEERLSGQYRETQRKRDRRKQAQEQSAVGVIEASRNRESAIEAEYADRLRAASILPQKTGELKKTLKELANARAEVVKAQLEYDEAQSILNKEQARIDALVQEYALSGKAVPEKVTFDNNALIQNATAVRNQSFLRFQLAKNEEFKLLGEKDKTGEEIKTISAYTINPSKQADKARLVQQKRIGEFSAIQQEGDALRLFDFEILKLKENLIKELPSKDSNLKLEKSALKLEEQNFESMTPDQQLSMEGFDLQDSIDKRRATVAKLEDEIENTKKAIAKTDDRLQATKLLIDENSRQLARASAKLMKANELVDFTESRERMVLSRRNAATQNFNQASRDMEAVSPQQYPKAYLELIERVAKRKLEEHEIPQLVVSNALPKGTNAEYNQASHRVIIRPEAYQKMQSDVIDEQTSIVGAHELQHGAQFGFGSFAGFQARRQGRGVAPLKTTDDLENMSEMISLYDDKVRDLEIDAELTGREVGKTYASEQLQQRVFKSKASFLGKTKRFARINHEKNSGLVEQIRNLVESNKGFIDPKPYNALLKEIEAQTVDAIAELDQIFEKFASSPVSSEQELLNLLENFAEKTTPHKQSIAESQVKLEKISFIASSRIAEASTPEAIATRTGELKKSATVQNQNIKEAIIDHRSAIATERARINKERDRIDAKPIENSLNELEKVLDQLELVAELKQQKVYNTFVEDADGMRKVAARHAAMTRISTLVENKADDIGRVRSQIDDAIAHAAPRVEVLGPEQPGVLATTNNNKGFGQTLQSTGGIVLHQAGATLSAVGHGVRAIASSPVVRAIGGAAQLGYRALEGAENLALDMLPMGRTLKSAGKNVVIPAAMYTALTHAGPFGHAVGAGIDSMMGMLTSPVANNLGSALAGQASATIGNLLPAHGAAGHFIQPVVESLQGAVSTAIKAGVTQGVEIATATATAVMGGRAVQSVGQKTIATLPGVVQNSPSPLLLPASEPEKRLSLPESQKELQFVEIEPEKKQASKKSFAAEQSKPKATIVPTKKDDIWEDDLVEMPFDLPKPIEDAKAIAVKTREAALSKVQDVKEIVGKIRSTMNSIEDAVQSGDMKGAFNLVRAMEDATSRAHSSINEVMADFKDDGATRRALGGLKGHITQAKNYAKNFYQENEAKSKTSKMNDDVHDVIDISFESKSTDINLVNTAFDKFIDHALDKLDFASSRIKSGIESFTGIEEQPTLKDTVKTAAKSDKAKELMADVAANLGGAVGSSLGSHAGPVAEKAGSYIGTVAGRQAANIAIAYSQASKEVETQSSELVRQVEIFKKTISGLSSGELGIDQKDGLFGDTIGWLTSLVDPAGGISAIPIVPALQKVRDELSNRIKVESSTSSEGQFGSLASLNGGGMSQDEISRLKEAEKHLKAIIDQFEAWDRAVAKMNKLSISLGLDALRDELDPIKAAESIQVPNPVNLKDRNLRDMTRNDAIIEQKFRDAELDSPVKDLSAEEADRLRKIEAKINRSPRNLFRRQKRDRPQLPGKTQIEYTADTKAIVGDIETELKFKDFEARAYASEQLGTGDQNHSEGWIRRKTRGIQRKLGMKPSEIKDQEVEARFQQLEEEHARLSAVQASENPDSVAARLDQQIAAQQAEKNAKLIERLEKKIAKRSRKTAKTNKDNQINLSDRVKRLMLAYDTESEYDNIRGGDVSGPNDPNNPGNTGRQRMRLQNVQSRLATAAPRGPSRFSTILQGAAAASVIGLAAPRAIDFAMQQGPAAFNEYIEANKQQTAYNFALGSTLKGTEAYNFAKDTSQRLGIERSSSVAGFAKIATASRGTSMEGLGAKNLFEGSAQASTVLGLSGEDNARMLKAFTDSLSKGSIQAEELRGQLGDVLPDAVGLFARAIGVSTAQLNKMMERGEIVSTEVLPKVGLELKRTFGPDAQAASDNMQSSMFRMQNQFKDLQVASINAISPLLNAAIKLVTESMQMLISYGPILIEILGALGLMLTVKVVAAALEVEGAFKNILNSVLDLGKKAVPAIAEFTLKLAAVTAAIQLLINVWSGFGVSDLGKGFEEAGNRAVIALQNIIDKANEAKTTVKGVKLEPEENKFKPKDFIDQGIGIVNKISGAMDEVDRYYIENVFGGKYTEKKAPFKMSSERQYENDVKASAEQADKVQKVASSINTNEYESKLKKGSQIDAQLVDISNRRQFLTGLKAPSELQKAELVQVEKAYTEKTKEQANQADAIGRDYAAVRASKESAEKQLENIASATDLTEAQKKALSEPWERALIVSKKNLQILDNIGMSIRTSANEGKNLVSIFADVAEKLDEAQRNSANMAARQRLSVTQLEVKGQFTDSLIGVNTAKKRADIDLVEAQRRQANNAEAQKTRLAALSSDAAKARLSSISTPNGKTLTLDSSMQEVESAKKGLSNTAADAGRRELLDQLIEYKKAKEEQVSITEATEQARIKLVQAGEAAITASIDREVKKREFANRVLQTTEANRITLLNMGIRGRLAARVTDKKGDQYDQMDANVDLSKSQVKMAEINQAAVIKQELLTQKQIADLEKLRQSRKITAAEYEKRRESLDSSMLDIRTRKAEGLAAIQDAKIAAQDAINARILDRQTLANRKAEAAIALSQSQGSIKIQRQTLSSLTGGKRFDTEQAELANIGVNARANTATVSQIKAELVQVQANEKAKVITRRESIEKQLDLQQKLSSAIASGLDLEIQRQQKLRAIAIGAIEDRLAASERAVKAQESALSRELAIAVEYAQKRLDLEEQLTNSRAELMRSRSSLEQSRTEGGVKQADEALALRKRLDDKSSGSLVQETARRQLSDLGFSPDATEAQIIAAKDERESKLARQKMNALEAEESIQGRLLEFEMKKLEFAAKSAEIEAKKAELLAKQADRSADLKMEIAQAMAPGRERDRAIANASAEKNAAQDALAIAREQSNLSKEQAALLPQLRADKSEKLRIDQERARLELGQSEGERRRARELDYAAANGATGPLTSATLNDFAMGTSRADQRTQNGTIGTSFAGRGGLTQEQAIAILGNTEYQKTLFGNDIVQTRGSIGQLNQKYAGRSLDIQGRSLSQQDAIDALRNPEKQRSLFGDAAINRDILKASESNTAALTTLTDVLRGVKINPSPLGASLPGRAAGGRVFAGQPYLVGELGPEPFVPDVHGSIFSNSAYQAMMQPPPVSQPSFTTVDVDCRSGFNQLAQEIRQLAEIARGAVESPREVHIHGEQNPVASAASIFAQNTKMRLSDRG